MNRFNPFTKDFWPNPSSSYASYIQEEPVHYGISPYPKLDGMWYIFEHRYAEQVLKDMRFNQMWLSEDFLPVPPDARSFLDMLGNWMVFHDPPIHDHLRGPVLHALTPNLVSGLADHIRQHAEALILDLIAQNKIDLVTNYASQVSLFGIMSLLGIPQKDWSMLQACSKDLNRATFFLKTNDTERFYQVLKSIETLQNYFRPLIEERRATPQGDLISRIAEATTKTYELPMEQFVDTCLLLLATGHETSELAIGKSVLALLRNRSQWELLQAEPALINSAVNELLRYDTPVQMLTRWCQEDITIGDKLIRKGDHVAVVLGAANHDPAQFPDPSRLDIRRNPTALMSFGHGIHTCLGQHLAKLNLRIALETLLKHAPNMVVDESGLTWKQSPIFHGLLSMPVTLGAPSAIDVPQPELV